MTQQPAATAATAFHENMTHYIRAGYQILYVTSSEEARVEQALRGVADSLNMPFVTWNMYDGMAGPGIPADQGRSLVDPMAALRFVGEPSGAKHALFAFYDFDDFFEAKPVRRAIRSLCTANRLVNEDYAHTVVIVSPRSDIPHKLRTCVTLVDFDLPGEDALRDTFDFVRGSLAATAGESQAACSDELRDLIVTAMLGLTATEAENTLSRCLVQHGGIFCEDMLHTIRQEKAQAVRKNEALSYLDVAMVPDRQALGGFDNLLEFVDRRKLAYTREARGHNLDMPKGIVLLGVPGTGKSLAAMAVSRVLNLPLYTLDVGAVFNSLVGESEARMRDVIRTITAQNGCVLLIDEADKVLGGDAGNRTNDVSVRIFGQLLSWLAAKQDRTFVILTMNRIIGMSELLRAGRFDAVFYTDLPDPDARRDILEIHLRKRHVDPTTVFPTDGDWSQILQATEGFVGAELEQVVVDARFLAFERRNESRPTVEEVAEAAAAVVPLSRLDAEGIDGIRKFCANRARPVAKPSRPRTTGRRGRRVDAGQN